MISNYKICMERLSRNVLPNKQIDIIKLDFMWHPFWKYHVG